MNRPIAASLLFFSFLAHPCVAEDLKAGAAAARLSADDSMVIGGGIGPGKAQGQEGELRASAVVIEGPRAAERIAWSPATC